MRSVGIKRLRDRLGQYVRLAAAGERILVTNRGRGVAELVPVGVDRLEDPSGAALLDLIRRGLLSPAMSPGAMLPKRMGTLPLARVLHDIEEDRRDR